MRKCCTNSRYMNENYTVLINHKPIYVLVLMVLLWKIGFRISVVREMMKLQEVTQYFILWYMYKLLLCAEVTISLRLNSIYSNMTVTCYTYTLTATNNRSKLMHHESRTVFNACVLSLAARSEYRNTKKTHSLE